MMSDRIRHTALPGALFVLVLGLVNPSAVHSISVIHTVTDFGDTVPGGAPGQLRKLINDASPGDTIVIPAGTITLAGAAGEDANATGDLDIAKNLTIQGAGAGVTIIDGGGIDRVYDVFGGTTVNISGMTIRNGNAGTLNGGGIRNNSTLTLTGVIVSGNAAGDAGGGIYNSTGAVHLTNATLTGNAATGCCGGGIYNSDPATASLANVTISNNTATFNSGGLRNDGTMTLTNVTISGNSASDGGGGIMMAGNGTLTLNSVTITNNSAGTGQGGGIHLSRGSNTMKHTLVAGNTGGLAPDCFWSLIPPISQGHNLVGNATGCDFSANTGDLVGTGANPIDPLLGPLADNGGPTQTHALLPGSPAIDAGTNDGCPATDQRGITRPQGLACDIGAFEVVSSTGPGPTARQLLNVATFVGPTTPPTPQQQQQTFRITDPILAGATYYDPSEACLGVSPAAVKLFVFTLDGQLVLGRNRETGGVTSTQIGTSKYQALLATLEPEALAPGAYNAVFWVKDCTDTYVMVSEFATLQVLGT